MKKALFILMLLYSINSSGQKIYGIDVSNVGGSSIGWEWDINIGTYTKYLGLETFDAVYKFPDKEFRFVTYSGIYNNMPYRYELIVEYLTKNFGKPVFSFSDAAGLKSTKPDSVNFYEYDKPVMIYGNFLEFIWFIKSNSKHIRLTLEWTKQGIQLTTMDYPLMSARDIKDEVLRKIILYAAEYSGRKGNTESETKESKIAAAENYFRTEQSIEFVEFATNLPLDTLLRIKNKVIKEKEQEANIKHQKLIEEQKSKRQKDVFNSGISAKVMNITKKEIDGKKQKGFEIMFSNNIYNDYNIDNTIESFSGTFSFKDFPELIFDISSNEPLHAKSSTVARFYISPEIFNAAQKSKSTYGSYDVYINCLNTEFDQSSSLVKRIWKIFKLEKVKFKDSVE